MRRWTVVVATAVALVALAACGGGDDDTDGTPEDTVPPLAYVALGDSFSAGVGAPPYDEASGSCQRSDLAWPYVLADEDAAIDLELDELRACGGAKVPQLLEPWTDRDEPAQIPDEPDPSVGLVTLTIGGNDVGFGEIVAQCVLIDCSGLPTSPEFTASLNELTARLSGEVYPALRAAYPQADLVHVGYPKLTPAPGADVSGCVWLSPEEQVATGALVELLNQAIGAASDASSAADVTFVDVGDAFAGHELCTADPYVNPISLDADRAHPTAAGYRALATAVAEELR